MSGSLVALGVSSFLSRILKFADAFINVRMYHFHSFKSQFCVLSSLRVLELVCKFHQKLVPYGRDVVCYRI